jgi:Fe-S-cluster-containing dehydrogenase component
MARHRLRFNRKNCTGCHACEIACKQEHGLGVGPRLVRVIEGVSDFLPVYCHHCGKPPCKEACPVDAISRNDRGIVLIDSDLCTGCGDCLDACPFSAIQLDEKAGVAVKCDLCLDRIEDGKPPSCVSVCPSSCIEF